MTPIHSLLNRLADTSATVNARLDLADSLQVHASDADADSLERLAAQAWITLEAIASHAPEDTDLDAVAAQDVPQVDEDAIATLASLLDAARVDAAPWLTAA